ncbi:pentapeptide repeat-containing protein [Streptomyces javensis]|uniref:Pentapeptide repeat-containing protein n=1 Tax=Streptomyces javensis TaxID=114698 RepID=A0ABS0R5K9_9ACTN|nr:pentapeptide repeat-containing protein [Streptomyces javensis]
MGVPTLRRRAERRGLRLWPVGTVLVLSFTTAVLVAAAVFYTGWDLLGARGLRPEHRIDSKTLFDLVKLSFGVVAGAGALVALVVAYRRQRVDEDGALREATRLHTERFTTAVSQLGDESAAVRLGGVHALAGLADDAPTRDLRQTCIDVLCAYLRLPYTADTDLPDDDAEARLGYLANREVRHTIIRVIADRLRLPRQHPRSWQGHDFDFTEVVFDGGDMSAATFSGGIVDFSSATFAGGKFNFTWARFSGAAVYFNGAKFSGGEVYFNGAKFSDGEIQFNKAEFSGGRVLFTDAKFLGGEVDLINAAFPHGVVDFTMATFEGSSTVNFISGTFSGGNVAFRFAKFLGGKVDFGLATFSGSEVTFEGARFSGSDVHFDNATFSGGEVDFSNATGSAPSGLVLAGVSPMPTGLLLPSTWSN